MKDKIVFSTNPDYTQESEEQIENNSLDASQQNLRIWIEKRPGNKVVSIIRNFKGSIEDFKQLEKEIKKKVGVGGSIKGDEIIIQTKDRQKLLQILNKMGYFAKLSGG